MPRYNRSSLQAAAEFGIDIASQLSGIPECTLRMHADEGKVMGVRRTASGRRLISRDGLIAYAQARGIKLRKLDFIERRRAERIGAQRAPNVRFSFGDERGILGEGEGPLVNLSLTGCQGKDLFWKGCLPGPKSILSFTVLGGELRGVKGTARASRVLSEEGIVTMGLKVEGFVTEEAGWRWETFVRSGIITRLKLATARLEGTMEGAN